MNPEKTDAARPVDEMTFEECYNELQQLVEQFERGQMPLMQSVDRFERGMLLLKRCNEQLAEAEQRVEHLLQRIEPAVNEDASSSEGFSGDEDDGDIPF
ncbi:MAG TPA: exodeoxyribonuclease VII small subunit [bacterium]|nr:exodeoxyribonuclease VII small subunit [bacterium]